MVAGFIFLAKNHKDDLKEPGSREHHRTRLLSTRFADSYRNTIRGALGFIDALLQRTAKTPPLLLFWSFSVIYVFAFFYFFWVFGGSGALGMATILPPRTSTFQRYLAGTGLAALLVFYLGIWTVFWRRAYAIPQIRHLLLKRFSALPDPDSLALPWPIVLLIGIVVVQLSMMLSLSLFSVREALPMVLTFPVVVSSVVLGASTFLGLRMKTPRDIQLRLVGAIGLAGIAVLGAASLPALFLVRDEHVPLVGAMMLFGGLLPLLCGVTDYLAWIGARLLTRRLLDGIDSLALAACLLGNVVAAFMCVHIGAMAILGAVALVNQICFMQRAIAPFSTVFRPGPDFPIVGGVPATWLVGPLVMCTLPFLLNLFGLVAGALTIIIPAKVRSAVAARLEGEPTAAQLTFPALFIASIPCLALVFVLLCIVLVAHALEAAAPHVLNSVLEAAGYAHGLATESPKVVFGLLLIAVVAVLLWQMHTEDSSVAAAAAQAEHASVDSAHRGSRGGSALGGGILHQASKKRKRRRFSGK